MKTTAKKTSPAWTKSKNRSRTGRSRRAASGREGERDEDERRGQGQPGQERALRGAGRRSAAVRNAGEPEDGESGDDLDVQSPVRQRCVGHGAPPQTNSRSPWRAAVVLRKMFPGRSGQAVDEVVPVVGVQVREQEVRPRRPPRASRVPSSQVEWPQPRFPFAYSSGVKVASQTR